MHFLPNQLLSLNRDFGPFTFTGTADGSHGTYLGADCRAGTEALREELKVEEAFLLAQAPEQSKHSTRIHGRSKRFYCVSGGLQFLVGGGVGSLHRRSPS